MSAHTPGPWFIDKRHGQEVWISSNERDPHLGHEQWEGLAVVNGCDDDKKNGTKAMLANARLIAAAPELYEALTIAEARLRHIAETLDVEKVGWMHELDAIAAALAKVTP